MKKRTQVKKSKTTESEHVKLTKRRIATADQLLEETVTRETRDEVMKSILEAVDWKQTDIETSRRVLAALLEDDPDDPAIADAVAERIDDEHRLHCVCCQRNHAAKAAA